jgi:hypothetical protein
MLAQQTNGRQESKLRVLERRRGALRRQIGLLDRQIQKIAGRAAAVVLRTERAHI